MKSQKTKLISFFLFFFKWVTNANPIVLICFNSKLRYILSCPHFESLCTISDLKDATNRRNLDLLNKAIKRAEESDYASKMQVVLQAARTERDQLLQLKKFMHDILEMKQSTISEMTSYLKPPPAVHDTLTATLLLLGVSKEHIEVMEISIIRRFDLLFAFRKIFCWSKIVDMVVPFFVAPFICFFPLTNIISVMSR